MRNENALRAMGAKDAQIRALQAAPGALFLVRGVRMLAKQHAEKPIAEIHAVGTVFAKRRDGRLVVPAAVDYVARADSRRTAGTSRSTRRTEPLRATPEVDQMHHRLRSAALCVAINKFIGRRPVFAFGNSDGDQQMLEWTAAVGQLDTALALATAKGWTVVDIKKDWKRVFPFEPTPPAK